MTAQILKLDPTTVVVPPDRQRKDLGDLTDLKESIQTIGQLNPIIVDAENALVAGERRLKACQALAIPVLARRFEELSPTERQTIELHENIKRKQLTWQEEAEAYSRLVALLGTQQDAARFLGASQATVSRQVAVANAIKANPELAKAANSSVVVNTVARKTKRELDALIADLVETDEQLPLASVPTSKHQVLRADFLEWASTYNGPRFNVCHCDFPYGLNMDTSRLQNSSAREIHGSYDDSQDLYFNLLAALCAHHDRLLAPDAHILFWLSPKFWAPTFTAFHNAGLIPDPFPWIWGKSDMAGLVPDPRRGPRRCYEMAMFVRKGDPFIVQAKSNYIHSPTTKEYHLSEKPMPVVQHFLSMLVSDVSAVLDPTCGSGTALAAAVTLGATKVLGLDILEANCITAQALIDKAQTRS